MTATFQARRPINSTDADPVWMSHHEYEVRHPKRADYAKALEARRKADEGERFVPGREFPCRGQLRLIERGDVIWTAECDACSYVVGLRRSELDTAQLIAGRMAQSRIPQHLVNRDYLKTQGNEAARALARLFIDRWGTPHQEPPPLLYGATGRGKTHLLAQTGAYLVKHRMAQVRYWTVPDLLGSVRRLFDRDGENGPDAFIEKLTAVQLLILDDIGAEHHTGWAQDVLYRLIDGRERLRLPIMGATNLDPSVWADAIGDRNASRLAALSTAVEVTGDDHRESDALAEASDRWGGVGNVVPFQRPTDSTE